MPLVISDVPTALSTWSVGGEAELDMVDPYGQVSITDTDPTAIDGIDITVNTATTLFDTVPGVMTEGSDNTYVFSGTAAQLQTDLRGLWFQDPIEGSALQETPYGTYDVNAPPVTAMTLNVDGFTSITNIYEIYPGGPSPGGYANPNPAPPGPELTGTWKGVTYNPSISIADQQSSNDGVSSTGDNLGKQTPPPTPVVADNFSSMDTTTGVASTSAGASYTGPVTYLTSEFISPNQDSLNIASHTPNAFIVTGAGNDAIDVSAAGGSNVISASTGNNFLTGGAGSDTFFVDERGTSAVWDTINGFHAGDGVTIWGMTPQDIFTWQDGQGATGYSGLTFHTAEASGQYASMTLAGFSQADLTSGKVSETFGSDSSGNAYLYISGH